MPHGFGSGRTKGKIGKRPTKESRKAMRQMRRKGMAHGRRARR